MKYRISDDNQEELIIITEDGGVATIRDAEENDNDGRRVTTEYYQNRINTDILKDRNPESEDVWTVLGEGKSYYNDWGTKTGHNTYRDYRLIEEALAWLVCFGPDDGWVRDDTIWRDIFPD